MAMATAHPTTAMAITAPIAITVIRTRPIPVIAITSATAATTCPATTGSLWLLT